MTTLVTNDTPAECLVYKAKAEDLTRRCGQKETHIAKLTIKIAKAEENIEDLEKRLIIAEIRVVELQAWRNKALGYLSVIGVITFYVIDLIKDHLLYGND